MLLPRKEFIFFVYIVLFPPLLFCQSSAEEKSFTIVGVGDIMPGTDYPSGKYLPPGDGCHHLMENVIPFLRDADITFGNLEGSFAGSTARAKICHDTLNCYVFRIPERYISCLIEAGFDIMSLANNHSGDFGQEGRDNTMKVLDDAGIAYAGLIQCPFTVVVRDSVRFGLCAFAPNPGTCSITDIKAAAGIVRELKKKCDIVIVSFHGGAEGKDFQHVPGNMETYLGQNRGNVYEFSHAMIDAGGDLLFGHGPHVSRAIEIYKERLICYSMGNFCTYGRFNLQGPNGIAPLMRINVDRNGKFLQGEIIPIKQTGRGVPEPDPEKQAIHKIRELTRADFPEASVEVTDEGVIFYKIKDKR